MEKKLAVHAIYFDCKSAFDLIDVDVVSEKLPRLGINKFTVRWIVEFLTDRSLSVGSFMSRVVRLSRGTLQGTRISSLIFSVMIYDLSEYLPLCTRYAIFADDIKLFAEIVDVESCMGLQRGIDGVVKLCHDNNNNNNFIETS